MEAAELILKKDKEFGLRRGHYWVYREAVKRIPESLDTGSEVRVVSHKGDDLGRGYVDIDSPILVRRIDGDPELSLDKLIRTRVIDAVRLRRSCFDEKQTTGYRLINGEGDGIPGLVVDRYASALSVQLYSLGLEPWFSAICETLRREISGIRWIYRRNQVRRAKAGGDGLVFGRDFPGSVTFLENGMSFRVDLASGQKTGFFLDQRDNRALIRTVARGKTVANVCGYTG
ncbi:MAG TPA: class I SAM-dependent methyltransferase, partial [Candidatus Ozemobacteraceae bacterium]|nr:class I SAM-dependent methyltransferase [Candidatus Ozemobacteraceae bacterium]